MKKFFNYYLPIAAYYAIFLFVLTSVFFVKKTPETENVVIQYETSIFYFVTTYSLLPLLGFAYVQYFFYDILFRFNRFLIKRFTPNEELSKEREKIMQERFSLITIVIFIVFLIVSYLC